MAAITLAQSGSIQQASPTAAAAAATSHFRAIAQVKAGSVGRNLSFATQNGGLGSFRSYVENAGGCLGVPISSSKQRAVTVQGVYTEKQEALVKGTWAVLKKDAAHHALSLFLTVFEIAPAAKKLFSFLKDSEVPLDENPKLKAHALQVFVIICEAASSLSKKGQVLTPGSSLKDMAHSHLMSGVVDEHYDVVRYSLLKTVQAGLPADMWNEEVKDAWADAYNELVLAIKAQEEYKGQS